ncbi:hypothetical protein IG631_12362 [Alternaria alternata]|nr:hypothetical protein IG631_12362 [Alternaria alternata]
MLHRPSSTSFSLPAKSSQTQRACTLSSLRQPHLYPARSPSLQRLRRPSGRSSLRRRVSRTRSATASLYTTRLLASGYPNGVTRARTRRVRTTGWSRLTRRRKPRQVLPTMRGRIVGKSEKRGSGATRGRNGRTASSLERLVRKLEYLTVA